MPVFCHPLTWTYTVHDIQAAHPRPLSGHATSYSNQYQTPCQSCGPSDSHGKVVWLATTSARSWPMTERCERQRHDGASTSTAERYPASTETRAYFVN